MKITVFGLSITSSWGNGHATTYRALCNALARRGHHIVFFEHDAEWYANNRDVDGLPKLTIVRYQDWNEIRSRAKKELDESEVAMVGSYFPHAHEAMAAMFASRANLKTFYDIDTPITLSQLRESGETSYLRKSEIPELDIYFSFTGGPALRELERCFGARRAVPLYCSVETQKYRRMDIHADFACEMSYMGTYAPDRQPKLDALLCQTAFAMKTQKFIVAGPQYPLNISWPANVLRIEHLEPKFHPHLYSSSRLVLNVTRRDMVMAGYSPSVRLFEAAACGATIVSDNWPGLDQFLTPGKEILLASSTSDAQRYLSDIDSSELWRIGNNARQRVLAEHSSEHRAAEFELHVASAVRSSAQVSATAS
jgi:spore maturation protein CgeB